MPVIPALGRLRPQDHEFKASMDYMSYDLQNKNLSQKRTNKKTNENRLFYVTSSDLLSQIKGVK
jgi:hypothetical protein